MCETDKNTLEQTKQSTESTCCCKQLFSTKNLGLKFVVSVATIILVVFTYNEMSKWFAYRNIENTAGRFFFEADNFGWTTIGSRIEQDIDSVNNKMLLSYIAKQQNEIIKNQKTVDTKLNILLSGKDPKSIAATKEIKEPMNNVESNESNRNNTVQNKQPGDAKPITAK